ncbi:MAG: DUF3343 domain-containing protein [Deltaproteobacteria bacterium]|nr:DUF3343 domain-containing protein [Deltaproteobacteria bacterium]
MGYLLAFGSAHRALKAESVLKGAELTFRLLPAPKALSAFCSLVISIEEEDLSRASLALDAAGVRVKGIYEKQGEEYVKM